MKRQETLDIENKLNEIWKDIIGYEGIYMISNYGNVFSMNNNKNKILKPIMDKDGYLTINLCNNGTRKKYRIHRLVAESFIENKEKKKTVNHKDENKKNNKVTNLEWFSFYENNNYGSHNEKISKSLSKKIVQLSLEYNLIKIWGSATLVKKELGFNQGCISACCRGKLKKHKEFKWMFLSDYLNIKSNMMN